jgi:hypothetical protein
MEDKEDNKVKQNHLNSYEVYKLVDAIKDWDRDHLESCPVTDVADCLSGQLGFLVTRSNLKFIVRHLGIKMHDRKNTISSRKRLRRLCS